MSTLKRKSAPGGDRSEKPAKKTKDTKTAPRPNATKQASTETTTKSTTASNDRPKPAVVSVLKDEEPMFPRGGGSVLTPLEQKQIQMEAKADARRDVEFNPEKKLAPKKKTKTKSKGQKKSESKIDEETVKIESLGFKV